MTSLKLNGLGKTYGDFSAVHGVTLEIASGTVLGLLGPSGCGKTTTLKCLAGLEDPTSGEIWYGDELVARPGFSVPPHRRQVGMVFQSYALWPHMSVYENVKYPLQVQRRRDRSPEGDNHSRVMESLALLGLEDQAKKQISELSGGQQQRVALARSIVSRPAVLLFDEPLSNLDAKLRVKVRNDLKRILNQLGITSVYVTHDQSEAMAVCDVVAVMNRGSVEQIGSPENLYQAPKTVFVADFLGGGNILQGTVVDTVTHTSFDNLIQVRTADGLTVYSVPNDIVMSSSEVNVLVREEDPVILQDEPLGEPNVWHAYVLERVYFGSFVQYTLSIGQAQLSVRSPHGTWQVGDECYLSIDPERVFLIDSDSAPTITVDSAPTIRAGEYVAGK